MPGNQSSWFPSTSRSVTAPLSLPRLACVPFPLFTNMQVCSQILVQHQTFMLSVILVVYYSYSYGPQPAVTSWGLVRDFNLTPQVLVEHRNTSEDIMSLVRTIFYYRLNFGGNTSQTNENCVSPHIISKGTCTFFIKIQTK